MRRLHAALSVPKCIWLGAAALCAACEPADSGPESESNAAAPAPVRVSPPVQPRQITYALRDTTPWANALYGGARAVLVVNDVVIDTIEVTSLQAVPGGFMYQPVRSTDIVTEECSGQCSDLYGWTMHIGYPVELSDMLPDLHPFFSSPAAIDSLLYYWGLDGPDADGVYRISARLYDFRDRSHAAQHLFDDALATDNPGHFRPPYQENGRVVFETWGRRFSLSNDLSSVIE
jgi:hypothetical protein